MTTRTYYGLFGKLVPRFVWSIMIIICLTNSLISNHIIGVKVQKARKEQKLAMAEYYEKHGGGGHH